MGINLALFFIQEELRQMERYLDLLVSALNSNFEKVNLQHEEALEQEESSEELSDDYVDWLLSKHQDEAIEAGEDFPQLLLISFIILWYSFVEQKLLDFCEALEIKISISPKDKKENLGEGIRRARSFLLRGRNYEIDKEQWQELLNIGKVRNLLIHTGKRIHLSYFPPDGDSVIHKNESGIELYIPIDKNLFEYLKKNDLIQISSIFLDIVPSIDYCKDLVKFGGEIFRKLYKDVK